MLRLAGNVVGKRRRVDIVSLTLPRRPCQPARRMVEKAGGVHPELSKRLETALVDAEPALRRLAERLCAGNVDARDLLQDTFERAVRQGIRAEVRNPCAWLATIMHNLFIDRCRAAAR